MNIFPQGVQRSCIQSFICVIFLTIEMIVLMMNDFPVPPHPITIACNGLYFFVVFEEFYYCVNCYNYNCCCCLERFFREYLDPSFCFGISPLVLLLCFFIIIVILSCDCVQVNLSFYSYPSIFQVITYRSVFVLPNVNCYDIDAFVIQFVISKMTVMYPPRQSFSAFCQDSLRGYLDG